MARAGRGRAEAVDTGELATDEPLAAWEAELLAVAEVVDAPAEVAVVADEAPVDEVAEAVEAPAEEAVVAEAAAEEAAAEEATTEA